MPCTASYPREFSQYWAALSRTLRSIPLILIRFGQQIRSTVDQWTRIPVSVGIATTKTLCKVANWYAKRQPEHAGVLLLDTQAKITDALADFDVADLWGVGWRYAGMLKRNDIRTAAQYAALPDDWIREKLTVNGLRLAYEIRGIPCKMLEVDAPAKKAICAVPSFGRLVPDLATIEQALVTHLSRAAEKLRKQGSAASAVTIFLHTNRHRKTAGNRGDGPGLSAQQYSNSRTVELPYPSSSTPELAGYAVTALREIFRFGFAYQKVGVMLAGLVPGDYRQQGLFTDGPDERLIKLSGVMDSVNTRFGRDRVRLAAAGFDPSWHFKRQLLSPFYTTRWADILTVR